MEKGWSFPETVLEQWDVYVQTKRNEKQSTSPQSKTQKPETKKKNKTKTLNHTCTLGRNQLRMDHSPKSETSNYETS